MATKHKRTRKEGPVTSAMRFSGKLVDGVAAGADRMIGRVVGFNPGEDEGGVIYTDQAYGNQYRKKGKQWFQLKSFRSPGYKAGEGWVRVDKSEYKFIESMIAKGKLTPPREGNPKSTSEMSAGEINKALDKLDAQSSKLTDEFIAAGRGHERPSDIFKMDDPLARRFKDLADKRAGLRNEIERRYGPGAPSRLPKGFGPIKRSNPGEPARRTVEFDSPATAKAFVRVMEADRMIAITKGPEKAGKKWLVEYADLNKQGNPAGDGKPWMKMTDGLTLGQANALAEKLKREDRKLRSFGTSGNYSNVEVRPTFERPGRKEYGVFVLMQESNGKRGKNPSSDAAAMYESFHGRPSSSIDEFEEPEHYRANLAGLGAMIGLKIRTVTGYDMTVEFNGDVMLCSNEEGTQLYLVGGDQAIDLKKVKLDDVKKDSIVVGEAWMVGYQTEKDFDNFEKIDYIHGFGEEKDHPKLPKDADLWEDSEAPKDESFGLGVYPTVRYDCLNERLFLDGGLYKIERPLIGTSPGIEG